MTESAHNAATPTKKKPPFRFDIDEVGNAVMIRPFDAVVNEEVDEKCRQLVRHCAHKLGATDVRKKQQQIAESSSFTTYSMRLPGEGMVDDVSVDSVIVHVMVFARYIPAKSNIIQFQPEK